MGWSGLAGPRLELGDERGGVRGPGQGARRAYSWPRRPIFTRRSGSASSFSTASAPPLGSLNGTTKPQSARLHQLDGQRQRRRDDRDAAGHVLGDLGRHRVAEVRLVLQQRQARPAPLRPGAGPRALGTKPCQCTASPAASMCARAAASAWPISSTAMPCGASRRPSSTISAEPRSGEMPADVDDAARPGRRGRLVRDVGRVGHHRVGAARTGRCSRARPGSGAGGARPAARRGRLRPAATGRSQPGSHAFVVSAAAVSSCTSQTVGGRLPSGRQHQQQLGVVHQQQVRAGHLRRPSRPARRAARPAGAGPPPGGMVTVRQEPRAA